MDLKNTGKFISERRKAKNLTQAKLAEILMISEKTVSKWECGNGFPDTSIMLELCRALDITANELLSAKLLDEKEYKEQAEKNLVLLKTEQQRHAKFMLTIEFILVFSTIILSCGLAFAVCFLSIPEWAKIVIAVGIIVVIAIVCAFGLKIEQKAGYYVCAHCGHKHIPTYKSVLFAMHVGTTRYMKCPVCRKWSWQVKTTDMS